MNQSEADTCWYVPEAVITTLIKASPIYSNLGEKVIIGFKAYILKESIRVKVDNG